jgi:hypothetical protein
MEVSGQFHTPAACTIGLTNMPTPVLIELLKESLAGVRKRNDILKFQRCFILDKLNKTNELSP